MNGFQKNVLQHLRDLYEDDPDMSIQSTERIAEDLNTTAKRLYNHDTDKGPLYHLWQAGLIWRYGNSTEGFRWQAAGASISWDCLA